MTGSSALLDGSSIGFDPHLQFLTRTECHHTPCGNRDLFAGLGVAARALVLLAQVEQSVRGAVGAELARLFLFDRYAGSNLPSGMKSIAIGLILQDHSRTLTDQDADRCVGQAVAALERGCSATLRG